MRDRGQLPRSLPSALLAVSATLYATGAFAYGDPELDWQTVETPHFRVHYDRLLDPIARRVATLAETIYGRVAPALSYSASTITEVVLTDDTDSANGSATALPLNTIRLYVTAPEDLSVLSDYDDWYTGLITHEFTHIAHLDNISGLPAVVNAVLGKTLAPNQAQPRWITEGVAVVSESRHTSAGRIRSTLFDMFLRADVLEDRVARLDQISASAFRWPGGNLPYLYGSRFVQWIVDEYGSNVVRAVSADYGAQLLPWALSRAMSHGTGRTYEDLYEGFQDYLRRVYRAQMAAVEKRGIREGTRITRHGRGVYYPRFLPRPRPDGGGEELVYFRDDGDARSGIYRMPLSARRDGDRPEELVARTSGVSTAGFTPSGGLVFNSSSVFKNYYYRNDLFTLPVGTTSQQGDESVRRRLTTGQRAQAADVSPDGTRVVFTVNAKGTTFLEIAGLDRQGTLSNRRDLVPSGRFEQAYTPRFSPDGRKVAYSVWTTGGYRDLRVVDVATGEFQQLTHDRAIDMTPVWSPDGQTIYFSSDRTGIFNIYAYDTKTERSLQVTNVRTGAVMPAISGDGKTLVYVGYGTYGYDLFTMRLDPERFLPVPVPADRPDPPADPLPMPLVAQPYSPLLTVAPRNYMLSLKPGLYGPNALMLSASGSDVVGHHGIEASITIEPSGPAPSVNVSYSYNRLPVDFSVSYFNNVIPRTGYKVNNVDTPYDETNNGITTGVSYSYLGNFDSHNLGVSFSVANFRGSLPFGSKIDPYSVAQADPPRGNLNVLHLGYGYSNAEGNIHAAGPVRGVSLSVGVDYASSYTGSSYSTRGISGALTWYLAMPWPGHHTLAMRTAGAVADGNYPRAGTYSVGGYDLANNSLPSTIFSGIFNGAFVLRGYPPGAYSGAEYLLENIEYRAPVVKLDRGIVTLPIYLRRVDGNLFIDYGGAFNTLDLRAIRFFHHGALIDAYQLHASVGAELWFGLSLGYVIDTQIRVGYAYGFSAEAIPGGQPYFVASTAF